MIAASQYSKLIEAYDFVTILLIIGVGGIAEIAKNKLLTLDLISNHNSDIMYLFSFLSQPV